MHPHLLPAHRQGFNSSASRASAIACRSGRFAFRIVGGRAQSHVWGTFRSTSTQKALGVMTGVVAPIQRLHTNSSRFPWRRPNERPLSALDVTFRVRPALAGIWLAQSINTWPCKSARWQSFRWYATCTHPAVSPRVGLHMAR